MDAVLEAGLLNNSPEVCALSLFTLVNGRVMTYHSQLIYKTQCQVLAEKSRKSPDGCKKYGQACEELSEEVRMWEIDRIRSVRGLD